MIDTKVKLAEQLFGEDVQVATSTLCVKGEEKASDILEEIVRPKEAPRVIKENKLTVTIKVHISDEFRKTLDTAEEALRKQLAETTKTLEQQVAEELWDPPIRGHLRPWIVDHPQPGVYEVSVPFYAYGGIAAAATCTPSRRPLTGRIVNNLEPFSLRNDYP